MQRVDMLAQLASRIVALPRAHPVRVALDGIDAAGKTWLANDLAQVIAAAGRPVIRASIDSFHRPRAARYLRGPDSPEGYYEDSFDYHAVREALLLPLGPGGRGRYRRGSFDLHTDTPCDAEEEIAPVGAFLIIDGVFLQRPELVDLWDYRIFVSVPFEFALKLAIQRDAPLFGSAQAVEARYHQRYWPGQRLYFAAVHPQERADACID